MGVSEARDSLLNKKIKNLIFEIQKNDQICLICVLNMVFFSYCGPQSPSYSKLRPEKTFSIQMCPLDGFELETPDLGIPDG